MGICKIICISLKGRERHLVGVYEIFDIYWGPRKFLLHFFFKVMKSLESGKFLDEFLDEWRNFLAMS